MEVDQSQRSREQIARPSTPGFTDLGNV